MTEANGTDRPSSPTEALAMLLEGNQRFVTGHSEHPQQDAGTRAAVAPLQRPFAVLLGCSDSRLAAEIIFDRGLGDLFVVRTAGHVLGPEVLGSIEYAVAALDVPLIVVLGHDSCGAIAAALAAVQHGSTPPGYIRDVVERVMLSVLAVRDDTDPEAAAQEHIRYTVELLTHRSTLIATRVETGECGVVGFSYKLAEGSVTKVAAVGV